MITRLLLLVMPAVIPLIDVIFALPTISTIVVVGLVGFWLGVPSWGPWLYAGVCLNLMQSRARLLYLERVNMATYVFSPSMVIQNGSSTELALGGVIGAVRSLVGGDVGGTIIGASSRCYCLVYRAFPSRIPRSFRRRATIRW